MKLVSKYTYSALTKILLGRTVRFTSDCEFFPKFDVTGKIVEMKMRNGEILIDVIINNSNKTHRRITIGSNMKNLQFEILGS